MNWAIERMFVQIVPLVFPRQLDRHIGFLLVPGVVDSIAGGERADLNEDRGAAIRYRPIEGLLLQTDDEEHALTLRVPRLGGTRRSDAKRDRDKQERAEPSAVPEVTLHLEAPLMP
ncbi:MAG: hypothetical protein ACYS6Z_09920 [Planctomycetota bacterium]|jgi:hypothetical protein